MSLIEILLVAVGLAMDAFAVSVCRGLKMRKIDWVQTVQIALCFGGFQALMPFLGYVLGVSFEKYIVNFDHWVVFALLGFIGGKMIWEALRGEEEDCDSGRLKIRELLLLGLATSIDALAVGITLALLPKSNIGLSVLTIGVVTFGLAFVGVAVGNRFGSKYKSRAELAGGIILVLIGLKILLDHLFFQVA